MQSFMHAEYEISTFRMSANRAIEIGVEKGKERERERERERESE